ncbi:MAG: hypothetical protein NTV09_04400 [Bacteroidetes bacterium]|nr:hypothetical protein [Bacteroidota bacterium]
MKKLLLLLFLLSKNIHAEEIPVLIFVNTYDQADSLGFNIVQSLPEFVYDQILAGKVILWDSPKKEDRIEAKTLTQIEKYAQTSFKSTNQLFIYENWIKERRSLTIKTVGFYFSGKKPNGEEVAYGFVDYAELDSVFQFTLVPSNADGNCGMTYDDALKQKLYNYNIVQYDGKRIESVKEALAIKNEIKPLLPKKKWSDQEDCKIIRYVIEDSVASKKSSFTETRKFLVSLEKYLIETPEYFLNIGGDQLTSDPANYKIHVDKVEMDEYWIKSGSNISYSIYSMKIYVNGSALNALPVDEIQQMDFLINFRSVNDFLKEKEFYFRIFKINSQDIPPEKAAAYLSGIAELRWSHLIEWARYQ